MDSAYKGNFAKVHEWLSSVAMKLSSFDRLVIANCIGILLTISLVIAAAETVGVRVRNIQPNPNVGLPVTASIHFTFSEAMDASSVEAHFSIQPDVAGSLS